MSPTTPGGARSRWIAGIVLVGLLVGLFGWMLRSDPAPTRAPPPSTEASRSSPAPSAPELAETKLEPRAVPSRIEEPPAAADSAPKPAAAPAVAAPAVAARKPDLDARTWILFRVKDEHGAPVPGAEIKLDGLRR